MKGVTTMWVVVVIVGFLMFWFGFLTCAIMVSGRADDEYVCRHKKVCANVPGFTESVETREIVHWPDGQK